MIVFVFRRNRHRHKSIWKSYSNLFLSRTVKVLHINTHQLDGLIVYVHVVVRFSS